MGSIGYIGGNIAYMGGGNLGMDYPYETNQGHFPLWKPPTSYFPRGEAPPPYEEAVALAQAEAAINTCTVSVATTTHRTMPMNICNNQEDGITTNTTNLINININNAGTITSVAAGENHQISTNTVLNNNNNGNTQPRSTQTISNQLLATSTENTNRNTTVSVCAYSNQNSLIETPNPITPSRSSTCNNFRCQVPKEVQTVSTAPKNVKNSEESNSQNLALPPPLFDVSCGGTDNNVAVNCGVISRHNNNLTTTPSSSRRYHRTIPRHFTSVDPLITSIKNTDQANKKPTCQCPVQHVPMSYMGTTHFPQQTHGGNNSINSNSSGNIFMTTLSTKLGANKNHNSNGNNSNHGKSIKKSSMENNNHSTLRRLKNSSSTNNQITQSNHITNSPSLKIPTISKQIVTPNIDITTATSIANPNSTASSTNQIHSILKNKSLKLLEPQTTSNNTSNTLKTTDILNPPFPIPFIDSKSGDIITENNHPVLPPKMYKNGNHSKQQNPSSNNTNNQKIHTISKSQTSHHSNQNPQYPTIGQQIRSNSMRMSFPNNNHQIGHGSHSNSSFNSKSMRRSNTNHNNTDNTNLVLLQNSEKSQSLIKINSTISFPANHITYSLPKPMTNGKLSLRTSITDVVSKVPSVITIPSPSSSTSALPPNVTLTASSDQPSTNNITYSTISSLSNSQNILAQIKTDDKPLPVCTTSKNCSNPKEHFLPNDTSLDDDYLSECENCKSAHGSRYYLDEEIIDSPQETMTLQRKPTENEDEHDYYRTSQTLPTNTKQKTTTIKNREPWFSTIPASSSSDEEINE